MKKLVWAALAAAGSLPAAGWAQVTIGGIIDGGVRLDSGTTTGSIKSVGSGLSTGSRLNFIGAEDLGGGMKAGFVLESGISIDTGAGSANPPGTATGPLTFGRTSAVALGGDNYGYLSFGRQYTPLWAVSAGPIADPFGATWLGGASVVNGIGGTNTRIASNSIVYSYGYTYKAMLLPAPRTGWGGALQYSAGEVAGSRAGRMYGGNLSYGGDGTWWVGYAINQLYGTTPQVSATATTSVDTPKLTQQTLAASYQVLVPLRLYVGYNTAKTSGPGTPIKDSRNWDVAFMFTFAGNQAVRGLIGASNDKTAANVDYHNWQLGYQYDFSKRTNAYFGIGQVGNSANSNVANVGSLGTYAKGSNARSAILGVRTNF
jgi:predicted porin